MDNMEQRKIQREHWHALRKEILNRITEIDRATPARGPHDFDPPKWWCEMMDVRGLVAKQERGET